MLFVDPWGKAPNHDGDVPANALFIGAWENYVFVDSYSEALFLVRDKRQDLLWSLASDVGKSMTHMLAARESGDPDWAKRKLSSGCVAGARREGTDKKAATRLLNALVRARIPHDFPRHPYSPGLLTRRELADIVEAVSKEFRRNVVIAESAQRRNNAPIIKMAADLGLDPRPAGHNDSAWVADCPRRSHTIMLSPTHNEFGCGYCRRKGGPGELKAFVDYVRSSLRQNR